MPESPVVQVWAALVERCTHHLSHRLEPRDAAGWEGSGGGQARRLRAVDAGLDGLLALLLRPVVGPNSTLAAELDRLVTCLRTLILLSQERLDLTLTFHPRHVELSPAAAQALRDAALLLVLWTLDDGAVDIALSLGRDEGGQVLVRLESSHPGLVALPEPHERVRTVLDLLAPLGGVLERQKTNHDSWLVIAKLPAEVGTC